MSKTPFPVVNNTYTNCFRGLNYLKKMMMSNSNKEKLKEFFSVYYDDEDLNSKKQLLEKQFHTMPHKRSSSKRSTQKHIGREKDKQNKYKRMMKNFSNETVNVYLLKKKSQSDLRNSIEKIRSLGKMHVKNPSIREQKENSLLKAKQRRYHISMKKGKKFGQKQKKKNIKIKNVDSPQNIRKIKKVRTKWNRDQKILKEKVDDNLQIEKQVLGRWKFDETQINFSNIYDYHN